MWKVTLKSNDDDCWPTCCLWNPLWERFQRRTQSQPAPVTLFLPPHPIHPLAVIVSWDWHIYHNCPVLLLVNHHYVVTLPAATCQSGTWSPTGSSLCSQPQLAVCFTRILLYIFTILYSSEFIFILIFFLIFLWQLVLNSNYICMLISVQHLGKLWYL